MFWSSPHMPWSFIESIQGYYNTFRNIMFEEKICPPYCSPKIIITNFMF
jgi:hypothetical protein